MDKPLRLDEAVTVVETPPYRILLEDLNTQRTVQSHSMVCQCFAKPSPMKGRFKKQSADLIPDKRNEAERRFILFQNPRLRVRKVDVTHILSYLRHEVVCQKRMCECIRFLPDLDKGISIFSSILSNHCFE